MIREELNRAPVGTRLAFDAYYSKEGLMEDVFTKNASSTWEHAWNTKNRKTHWTASQSVERTSSEIFNVVVQR